MTSERFVGYDTWGNDEVRQLLAPIGFADPKAADRELRHLLDDPRAGLAWTECLPTLLTALSGTPSPDRALSNFTRFALTASTRPAIVRYLAGHPRGIEVLVTLFGGSQFLTEILLRRPATFDNLFDAHLLAQVKDADQFARQAEAATVPFQTIEDQLNALRRFQQEEMLRIGACDLLGLLDMPTVTVQLSRLADALVRACLRLAAAEAGSSPDGLVVLAMGKLGGGELNYSSDIDLVFLAGENATAHLRLGERLIEALTRVTSEGFLYRVDMRLRPWGQTGALVTSIPGHLNYLRQHARQWERQALLKARPIAGDQSAGEEFLRQIEPLLFGPAGDQVRADMHGMKQRTEAYLRQAGRDWGEVKLGEGSIRDVEFVAQYLQLVHGGAHPEVRSRNTLEALARLFDGGFLSADEYRVCVEGYTFLRTIEHYLQMMDYRQTYTLPSDAEGLNHLARRLGFLGAGAGDRFVARYQQHSAAIRAVYRKHLEVDNMVQLVDADLSPGTPPEADSGRHLERLDPSYQAAFTSQEISRHAELADRLDDDNLVEVQGVPLDEGRWRVTVVAYDYLGEFSLICGLLFAYGFNILDGDIFTYEPLTSTPPAEPQIRVRRTGYYRRPLPAAPAQDRRQKIVDVFTVNHPQNGGGSEVEPDTWARYADDLEILLRRLQQGQRREAQAELAVRVALALHNLPESAAQLYPVEVEIDNEASDRYTVLRIDAPDTIGFLYEFASALAMSGTYIARMAVGSAGNRVRDTLWVSDARGQKITSPDRQRELRAATVLVKHFTHLLPQCPNPEAALLHFTEFLEQLFTRPNWPDELASLERPEVLHALAQLLGVSEFLWDDFLRMQHANLFPVVRDIDALVERKPKERLQRELARELAAAADRESRLAALNAFKDREMFRIDMRHIQDHINRFGQFSAELSDLAEVVVEATYGLCETELQAEFGAPVMEDGQPCPLSVCALGKSGGRELGFASDIELMFIYSGNGRTTGPQAISAAEFNEKLVQEFVRAIQARREGIFLVDLQLRPYGKAGSMAVSIDSFRRYFAPRGPAWAYERQALIKLRPVAGDVALGTQIVDLRDAFIYSGEPFDVAAMHAMRERQLRHLVTAGTINAKYSPGGLVDLEYLVQGLQINHGPRNPALRQTNTRQAMIALATAGILSEKDFSQLREAHRFLRRLIDALRMVRGNARDLTVPPPNSEEFAFLARRQGYGNGLARLRDDLTRHTACVREMSARLLG